VATLLDTKQQSATTRFNTQIVTFSWHLCRAGFNWCEALAEMSTDQDWIELDQDWSQFWLDQDRIGLRKYFLY